LARQQVLRELDGQVIAFEYDEGAFMATLP